jgi:predicted metallopeptidase/transcription elongation factor Elf1
VKLLKVRIKDKRLRREVEYILQQVLDRLPPADREIVEKNLDEICSRKGGLGKHKALVAANWRTNDKFKIVIFRDLFEKLSEKAKIGVLAHELRHIYKRAVFGYGEEILGSEFQIEEDLAFEWPFGEEAEALKSEKEAITGRKSLGGLVTLTLVSCKEMGSESLPCSLCGRKMETGYLAISEGLDAFSTLFAMVEREENGKPIFCFDCKEKVKQELEQDGILTEE